MDNFVKFQFKFNVMDTVFSNSSGLEGIITKRCLSEPLEFIVGEDDISLLEETYSVRIINEDVDCIFAVDELNEQSI